MPVFAFSIAADQDRPSEGDGFVRAETIRQAVALVGHPDGQSKYDAGVAFGRVHHHNLLRPSAGPKNAPYSAISAPGL